MGVQVLYRTFCGDCFYKVSFTKAVKAAIEAALAAIAAVEVPKML